MVVYAKVSRYRTQDGCVYPDSTLEWSREPKDGHNIVVEVDEGTNPSETEYNIREAVKIHSGLWGYY